MDLTIPLVSLVITFSHSVPGYIDIRPLTLHLTSAGTTSVTLDTLGGIPAGGRCATKYITLQRAPFSSLTIQLYTLGGSDSLMSVYPKKVSFAPLETKQAFWLSASAESIGTDGNLVVSMTSDDAPAYSLPVPLFPFKIVNPVYRPPSVSSMTSLTVSSSAVSFAMSTASLSTLYFAIISTNSLPVTIHEVKAK